MTEAGADLPSPPQPSPGTSKVQGLAVVKLGGSVITEKGGDPTLRPDALLRLLAEVIDTQRPVAIVGGAGSFGHTKALRLPEATDLEAAIAEIAADVGALHDLVAGSITATGAEPRSLRANLLDRAALAMAFSKALEQGEVPLTIGDIVPDGASKWLIFSGDDLAADLAIDLGAATLIYVCDAPGIRTHPEAPGILPEVTDLEGIDWGEVTDATGGMRHKAEQALKAASAGVAEVWIASGQVPGRIGSLLKGQTVEGTRVRRAA